MIIAKLIKPCKICVFDKEDGGEVESFSLLKLPMSELAQLLLKVAESKNEVEYPLDGSVVIKYSGNDSVHQLWKELVLKHEKDSPHCFIDISAQFKTGVAGTSCLVRDPNKHIIRIALREGDDRMTINRVCVDNSIRERFFYDAKTSHRYQQTKKFAIDTKDLATYTYWSKFMNMSFINQYKELKKKSLSES